MMRHGSIALVAFVASALAVPAVPGFPASTDLDGGKEIAHRPALVARQAPPANESSLPEPPAEDVKLGNQQLAESYEKFLNYLQALAKDLSDGKVQPSTNATLSPEDQKLATEKLLAATVQSGEYLVELAKPLVDGEEP